MTAAGESRVWTEFFLSPAMARDPATVCVQQDRLVSDPLHDAWYCVFTCISVYLSIYLSIYLPRYIHPKDPNQDRTYTGPGKVHTRGRDHDTTISPASSTVP